jgi:hypothetical protein
MPGDAGIQPRAGEQRSPFRGAEAAGDRDRAVQAHDAMPARGAAEEAKAVIWQRVAMQVGDEPAASAVARAKAGTPPPDRRSGGGQIAS